MLMKMAKIFKVSEKCQTEKGKYCMISRMCEIFKKSEKQSRQVGCQPRAKVGRNRKVVKGYKLSARR